MTEKTLYLECSSGISGDMTVAALLDLGADREVLKQVLASLPVSGFSVEISRIKKSGLDACDFCVKLDAAHENHDHDMAYLHGASEAHGHHHGHVHEEKAHCSVQEEPSGVHEHHEHRGLTEITEILRKGRMTDGARALAMRIFQILGEAEAQAHGVPVEQVHFHEVGAVDSIVDITAAAVCLDNLGVTKVIVPKLCEGSGFIRCQHGLLPVPVPAVANIVRAHHLHMQITEVQGELVTPTGAAIAAAVRTDDKLPEAFEIERIGVGAGKRNYQCPGLLRAMLIRETDNGTSEDPKSRRQIETDRIVCLQANVDDCTGEALGYVMGRLLTAGAKDVFYTPIYMKKNRPAYLLHVICCRMQVPVMEEIIFAETTTIGIRRSEMERTVLSRENHRVNTLLGEAEVKVCTLPDGSKRYYPEYESAAALAKRTGKSFIELYDIIRKTADSELN